MKKNESTTDRVIRAILAIVLFYLASAFLAGFWAFLVYVVGIALLITAITGYCGLYKAMNISTNKREMKMKE